MMDYFDSVEHQLSRAVRARSQRGWRSRLELRGRRRLAAAIALCAATAGSALAATGVIRLGAPVSVPPGLNPRAGSGVPAPGGSVLLPLRYPDPEGGPPWGMRVVRTTRGLVCVQVGRVLDGRLGVIGIDGAFHDDGRFHPLPAAALPDAGGAPRGWEAPADSGCYLPTQPFVAEASGVARSGGGPLDTTHMPRGRLRDLYFGLLGPDAVSVVYSEHSEHPLRATQAVVPGVGAYLFVRPLSAHSRPGYGGASLGTMGALGPVAPIRGITYRIGGKLCERVLPGRRAADPCPAPQSLYGPPAPAEAPLRVPLHASLLVTHRVVRSVDVRFRAPLAVTGAGQGYEVRVPVGPCHGAGGGYAAHNTDRDIAPGEPIALRLGDPFGGLCGKRTATIRAFYDAAGYPPREVGSIDLRLPAGTRPMTPPRRGRRGAL